MESKDLIGEETLNVASYKTRVMAVLADAPLNMLTNKEMLWAASNLPDGKVKGGFETKMAFDKVNHDAENLYESFNISEEDLKVFAGVMKDSIKYLSKLPEEEKRNSKSIEYIAEKLGNNSKFVISLIIKVMGDAAEKSKELDIRSAIIKGGALKEILKKLMEGRKDDDDKDSKGLRDLLDGIDF